jgi:hypothetical protein
MYENAFSTDREQVISWAKQNARAALRHCQRAVAEAEVELSALKLRLAEDETILAKLEANYFSIPGRAQ